MDPATHRFDPSAAREIAASVLPRYRLRSPGHHEARHRAEDAIDRALLAEYGFWAAGWRWSASEPGCGGFVRTYCCADDSLGRGIETDVETVVGALSDFRRRLEELAEEFARIRRDTEGLELAETATHAAASLLPLVVEWTGAEDMWYATFASVLAWFLEPYADDAFEVQALVEEAIGGRFGSWTAPDESVGSAVARSVGVSIVALAGGHRAPFDALATWREMRERIRWRRERIASLEALPGDGHLAFIDKRDRARDPVRAERMRDALEAARDDAKCGAALDFERLRAWQRIVLGEADVDFRRGDAYAHRGREVYRLREDTEERFVRCLAEAHDPALTPESRAARLYLDVSFFHPFVDGNARAARLALDYVLTASGRGLHAAEPVFVVARSARDERGVGAFEYVVEYLTGLAVRGAT